MVSPDGRWIELGIWGEDGQKEYFPYLMRPDGSDLHPIDEGFSEEYNGMVVAGWAPDGRRLAFHVTRESRWLLGVTTIDPETGGATEAKLLGVEGGIPMWSPDGNFLAYAAMKDGMSDLWVVESDGGNPRRITENPVTEWLACWSADPAFLYFWAVRRRHSPQVPDSNGQLR